MDLRDAALLLFDNDDWRSAWRYATAEDAMEGPWSADTAYRSCWAFMDHRLPVSRRLRRRVQAAMGQDAGCFGSSLTSLADAGIIARGRSGVCISKERRSCDLQ